MKSVVFAAILAVAATGGAEAACIANHLRGEWTVQAPNWSCTTADVGRRADMSFTCDGTTETTDPDTGDLVETPISVDVVGKLSISRTCRVDADLTITVWTETETEAKVRIRRTDSEIEEAGILEGRVDVAPNIFVGQVVDDEGYFTTSLTAYRN